MCKGLCLKSSSSALRVILSVSLPFDRFLVYLCPNPEIPLSHITPPQLRSVRLILSAVRPPVLQRRTTSERASSSTQSNVMSGFKALDLTLNYSTLAPVSLVCTSAYSTCFARRSLKKQKRSLKEAVQ